MNEREQLVNAINGCAGLLPQMEQLEDKIEITEAKIEKNRPRAGLLALAVIGVLLFFTGVSSSHDSDKILIPVGLFFCRALRYCFGLYQKEKTKACGGNRGVFKDSVRLFFSLDACGLSKFRMYIQGGGVYPQ